MIRFLLWLIFWAVTLFGLDIHVKYADGLTINLKGWWNRVFPTDKDK